MRLLLLGGLALVACEGRIATPGFTPIEPVSPPKVSNGWPAFLPDEPFELRRLTTPQYLASVRSLLQLPSLTGLPPIEPVSSVAGFPAIGASSAVVTSGGVAQFEDAARFLAQQAFATPAARARLVPCTPSGIADTACFRAFVTSFGGRAFRRPLDADELDRYSMLTAAVAASTNDAWAGLEFTLSAFLQSPSFLYLDEVGEPDPTRPGQRRYSAYELASRLSYFLTNDTPDDALLAAAASGDLYTDDGVRAQTERLLALPAARETVRAFFSAMLSLDALDSLSRPVQLFPASTPTLGAAMKEETLRSVEDLVFDRDGDYRALLASDATFVNGELAGFYGIEGVAAGSGFQRVTLTGGKRLGLLGQAGPLIVHDKNNQTSPTRRGLFVLTRLLCQDIPLAPPAGLVVPDPPQGAKTAREKLEQHSTNATCASCHQSMDAVGLSLEKLDAIGAYRDADRGTPIDDSGVISGIAYQGEPGLSGVLRDHPAAGPCFLQALYGSSVGHLPTEFDRDTFASMVTGFENGRVRSAMTAIALSDGFRRLP